MRPERRKRTTTQPYAVVDDPGRPGTADARADLLRAYERAEHYRAWVAESSANIVGLL